MFAEQLKKVVDGLDGSIGGVIMGLDGIAVETYARDSSDVNTIGMEFSFILTQAKKAGEILKLGGISEMAIRAETMTVVFRMLTDEYFLGVILDPSSNFGKARFVMRMAEPKIVAEL